MVVFEGGFLIMNSRFVLILAAIAVLFVGLILVNKKDNNTNGDGSNGGSAIQATNHTYGEGGKNVTLVEYGDFQCSACAAYYPILKELKERFKEDITFQYRHFPLVQIHQNALISSRAAEAAGKQDKFWEMHDLLFENQQAWQSSSNAARIFEDYAAQLGLNIEKFKTDMASDTVNRTVQADLAEARKLELTSTPSFLINGRKIENNPRDLESFAKLIQDEINKQNDNSN
jgi:protein-disulfide isomerase